MKEYYKENKEELKQKSKDKYQESLKKKGETTKVNKVAERREKIKVLRQQDLTEQQICFKLNISRRTYFNDLKHIT